MGRPRFSRALTLPLEPRHLAAQVDDFVALHGDLVLLFADQFINSAGANTCIFCSALVVKLVANCM